MNTTMYPILLSPNFSYAESIASEAAARERIENVPDLATLATMAATAKEMEKIRFLLNTPIHINSWYRCLPLNRLLKSKDTSQHIQGEAVDFICPHFGTPLQIMKVIVASEIPYDQLIYEHTWVHVSFSILRGQPRKQVLTLLECGQYSNGITDSLGHPIA